jgi:acyl-CoA synthetase (AMP-forming)/AMP-acid ligase II
VDLLIGDIFRNAAGAVPTKTAAALGDTSMTYGELHHTSNRTARAIAALGIGHGDRVVVWASTSLDTVPVFATLAKLGAVFAPVNSLFGVDEATEMASVARPALALVDQAHAKAGVELAARLGVDCVAIPDLLAAATALSDTDIRTPELSEVDPHVIFFTSGSTGGSKGVVLSHRANYLRTYHGPLLEPKGPMVCMFPMFHMAPWTIALQQWHARETIVFVESADAVTLCDAITRHRATRFYGIPAVWRRILDHVSSAGAGGGSPADLSSLRIADTGTSATPPELLEEIEAALPQAMLRVFYGSTEAGNVAQLDHGDMRRKPGSVGVPAPTTEVRLDDNGEVWVRGPLVFEEYFDNPDATAEAIVDGWYRTGDLAEVDGDGFLTIVGRARDVIRTGGETVSPSEVEAVLVTCPGVDDVAVIGMPHPEWGEVVCAVVSCAAAPSPTLDDVRAHCDGKLARFKQPQRLEIVDAIPRTAATNQVQRRLLVELLS